MNGACTDLGRDAISHNFCEIYPLLLVLFEAKLSGDGSENLRKRRKRQDRTRKRKADGWVDGRMEHPTANEWRGGREGPAGSVRGRVKGGAFGCLVWMSIRLFLYVVIYYPLVSLSCNLASLPSPPPPMLPP